ALRLPATLGSTMPQWSNTLERNSARNYLQAYAAVCAVCFAENGLGAGGGGVVGVSEAARGELSHHMVIRNGKIANSHPFPPTPWNANPRDSYGTPGPYEDAVQGQPIFEEDDREHFKGIDIMRTGRSFDPSPPCGGHMCLANGRTLEMPHSPTQSVTGE